MITMKIEGLNEARFALRNVKDGFPKAVSRSINSGLLAGRTAASKAIRGQYNVKAGLIKSNFVMKKATTGHLEGSLETKGKMLPLSVFNPKVVEQAGKKNRTHHYVYAAIVRGKKKLIKGAFPIPGGKFKERRQPERTPIFPVTTIGIPFMVGSKKIQPVVEKRMAEATSTALKYNVQYYLNQKK